jgi:hypothetical protein
VSESRQEEGPPQRGSPERPGEGQQDNIFTAFRRRRGRPSWLLLAILLLTLVGAWAALRSERHQMRVVTPHGIRTVQPGMTPQQVDELLGKPLVADRSAGPDCFRHGTPTLQSSSFVLYTVCYEGGRLKDVQEKRFEAWQVEGAGELVPPPAAGGSEPKPAP